MNSLYFISLNSKTEIWNTFCLWLPLSIIGKLHDSLVTKTVLVHAFQWGKCFILIEKAVKTVVTIKISNETPYDVATI